jgi:acyl-lipid omega-6 desaturase (Delta-12 desaturase)
VPVDVEQAVPPQQPVQAGPESSSPATPADSRDPIRGSDGSRREVPSWRDGVDRFARPNLGRSVFALATSVVPFIGLWALMYFSLQVSYLLTLALAVPTAGFLVRTFILFHDCAHGSFLRSRRANGWVGAVLALMVFTPFAQWRHDHAGHHATGSDLDRRGVGDVPTLTVAEYDEKSWWGRLGYRLFRNPLVMFGVGPIYAMLLVPRWISRSARPRIQRSVWGTNLALALVIGGLCWLIGWRDFVLVEAPLVPLAGGVGIWLFYVQHQFDDTWWRRTSDWSYTDAALRGSSYLRLPKILQFFTGNIGLHHVHHLSPKVPNYNLQRAHDETPIFHNVPKVSLWDGIRATRLKLWDEDKARLVTWAEHRSGRSRSEFPAL